MCKQKYFHTEENTIDNLAVKYNLDANNLTRSRLANLVDKNIEMLEIKCQGQKGEVYMTFGKIVRKYRKELDMTQGELAKKLGYADHTAISQIERGIKDIPRPKVTKFAEVLEIDPAILLDALDSKITKAKKYQNSILSEDEQNIIDIYRNLSNDNKVQLINILYSFNEGNYNEQ